MGSLLLRTRFWGQPTVTNLKLDCYYLLNFYKTAVWLHVKHHAKLQLVLLWNCLQDFRHSSEEIPLLLQLFGCTLPKFWDFFFLSEVFPAVGIDVPDTGFANAISIQSLVQKSWRSYYLPGLNICSHSNPSQLPNHIMAPVNRFAKALLNQCSRIFSLLMCLHFK